MNKTKIRAKVNEADKPISSLGEFPRALPALVRAQKVTERASRFGFDWPEPAPVWNKIDEELRELKAAISSNDKRSMREEMGDLLFSLVNLSRFLDIEAEEALSETVDRFLKRFAHVETKIREQGKTLAESSLKEMDSLWEEAKNLERNP